jgi:hypothetical protein
LRGNTVEEVLNKRAAKKERVEFNNRGEIKRPSTTEGGTREI